MFKHLLVPLDGSHLAEAALPAAATLAAALGSEVTLIHLIEHHAPEEVHGDRHLTNKEDAIAYLAEVAHRAFPASVRVETHVHTTEISDVARSIVEHTSEFDPDLIVMCTHGQSGLYTLVAGSIAQQVIAMGKTPVLLIHPSETEDGQNNGTHFSKLLVAMDGQNEHETGLEVVAGLAQRIGAELHLLTVIETLGTLGGKEAAMGRLLPGATKAMLDIAEESAYEHLQSHADAWALEGVRVTTEVRRGDPATQIVEAAKDSGGDLIVLGTHGKAGFGAFWAGSVAPRVLSMTQIPMLLIPVGKG
jgi:nucleotide-binding universal stress UspA family protein